MQVLILWSPKMATRRNVRILRPWQTRAHCCGHIVADTNVSPFACARNMCCGHKFCVRDTKMFLILFRNILWDCNGFYIGKTKRRLHDRKTEHFKALAKSDNTSAIADHVKTTGHNIKWDQFDILAKGKTDYHCKIKETLYIQELEPAFNVNVGSEKLMLY